ncbi:tRNA 5-methoxyuridine(34)/uridine 5-oxyacetic acid(34) synthase CmoB [Campylobacter geochelonis]|uniref:tRNA 5-methoxyuridine(34)/uridine 5-oxyacetic acid(34) synthase CmoB n=1 Tax=Campylobacter geochelonis TaxID=1780362 RepID=UPI000770A787|nr:tRNA 5-methoxyuridine(34)/uridine 5-oxyacetic acid(34) synthase CmoB [Campylobacter geochelonis]CZE48414.1 methyltransferase [Campylobacter geochelonis]
MNLDLVREENLKALEFKDNKEILSLLQVLPEFKAKVELGDVVKISKNRESIFDKNSLNDNAKFSEFKEQIYKTTKALMPWRKGPFEVFETFIDSEWQSFIKFNILKPHLNLDGKIVADVGCNNCYYLFKMVEMGASKLVGFDPSVRTYLQFLFLDKFIQSGIKYELLGVEHLPFYEHKFDTIFCLGVIYHRSNPVRMLKELKASLNKGGEVILDTMYIEMDGEFALTPKNSYAKMSNVYFIPSVKALQNWCERAKFKDFEVLATKETDLNEQRKTQWIQGFSLGDFLDPNDKSKTVEGYPAPKRVYVRIKA